MYKLGVTGPVASGKTALTRILGKLPGTLVVDVDQMAKGLYVPGSQAYLQVTAAFKHYAIIDSAGQVNRRKLGQVVFADPEQLEVLNRICFPLLGKEIAARLNATTGWKLAVIDAGVLLQAGWDSLCDEVWTTVVKEEVAVERVMKRDGLSRQEAVNRVASQMPLSERMRRSKVALETNGSVEELEAKVKSELQRLNWLWASNSK